MACSYYDLALIHAPSVYDFRNRDDILFAYLSNSDSVHVSPIFEMPPVGMLGIYHHVKDKGYRAAFFNVASRMLKRSDFDVSDFFRRFRADIVGFDLHWLAHANGALELARLFKEIHPNSKILMGGISATFFHEELVHYGQVDYVLRGFNTLDSVCRLLKDKHDTSLLSAIPNLTWKDRGEIKINPNNITSGDYSVCVDWNRIFRSSSVKRTPYNIIIPQAGCEYNCRFCGGSRYFFSRYMGIKSVSQKPSDLLKQEIKSVSLSSSGSHTVTMINFWHEYNDLFRSVYPQFINENIESVHYSFHCLPKVEVGRGMAKGLKAVFELSPDSSCDTVAHAVGRGKYSMSEMEAFIDLLIDDVYMFEIYFMIGLPLQTEQHIDKDLEYCEHLLKKYKGKRVIPYICPMLPFLDPGSEIFDSPKQFGYTLHYRSLEEHRRALTALNWTDRLNYSTDWLSRESLVKASFSSVRRLTLLKSKYGVLPKGIAEGIVKLIDKTTLLLAETEPYRFSRNPSASPVIPKSLRQKISLYNKEIFSSVRSQQRPVNFGFSDAQWFDTDQEIEAIMEGK